MNVNATEDDLRAIAEVLKLAAILDDRAPHADPARIAAWAEKIHTHKLKRQDLLDGLQAYYDHPSDRAIQIGDLIQAARKVRRDRNDREAEIERERRATALEAKAAAEIRTLAAGAVIGPVKNRTQRLAKAEIWLQTCQGKTDCQAAIQEFVAAKREAQKGAA